MERKKYLKFFNVIGLTLMLFFVACVTRNDKLADIDMLVVQGDYQEAYDALQEAKSNIYKKNRDSILWGLDSGMLAFHADKTDSSIEELTEADNQMIEFRKKRFGEQIAAGAVNDTVTSYNGYDYEYVFTSIMLSLNYLKQNQFDSGFVEIRRTQDKLQKIQVDNNLLLSEYKQDNKSNYVNVEEIKQPFVDSAFARLLSFWLYRADFDFSNLEVAARKYDEAIAAQPELYDFENTKITPEQFSTQGNRIQIVSLTDKEPILYSKRFSLNAVPGGVVLVATNESDRLVQDVTPINNESFLDAVGVIAVPGLGSSGLSVVFDVPGIATYKPSIDRIEVWANDAKLGDLTLTEDLEKIAVASFLEESKIIYARQITRVIIKSIAGIAAEQVDPLLGLATQVANNASEKADLRLSRYFPGKIWTGDFPVPAPGTYNVVIKYFKGSSLKRENKYTQEITSNNDNFNIVIDSNL